MAVITGGKIIEGAQPRPFRFAGTPVSGASGTLAGTAVIGSQLIDTITGKVYSCTNATPGAGFAWTLVGAQVP